MRPASICQMTNEYILVATKLRSRLQSQLIGVASIGYGKSKVLFLRIYKV